MTHKACKSKIHSVVMSGTFGHIHAKETGWESGMQSCIMPGLPMHVVKEIMAALTLLFCLKALGNCLN